MNPNNRPPVWFRFLVVATVAPVLLWPWMLTALPSADAAGDTLRTFICCMPAYSLLSGYLAYRNYTERREVALILIALAWIGYVALALLLAVHL